MKSLTTNYLNTLIALMSMGYSTKLMAEGASVKVPMKLVSEKGDGETIGTVTLADSRDGLAITTDLYNLPSGSHGFHVHVNGSCAPGEKDGVMKAASAAGDHFDPENTHVHAGPMGRGHNGDIPFLTVSDKGISKQSLVAPKLKLSDVTARSLVIHQGGDNYADKPEPLGGGGDRIACGVVPVK